MAFTDGAATLVASQRLVSLTLLNFEGPVLKAFKNMHPGKPGPNGEPIDSPSEPIILKDGWGTQISFMTLREFADFIDGKTVVTDSQGKIWNYGIEHENAKPSPLKIVEFIAKVIEQ